MAKTLYTSGDYLKSNPTWHSHESPWKVAGILRMLKKYGLQPKTICEVGTGAGDVLRILQENLPDDCEFWGYDIAPQAIELCQPKANGRYILH